MEASNLPVKDIAVGSVLATEDDEERLTRPPRKFSRVRVVA
jgi:hypothetical protein